MKMKIIRIERTVRNGISKTGNPYNIDRTDVTVQVPLDSPDGFGFKEMSYQYGNGGNYSTLQDLKGQLPIECNIELGASLNDYGSVQTVITGIDLPKPLPKM